MKKSSDFLYLILHLVDMTLSSCDKAVEMWVTPGLWGNIHNIKFYCWDTAISVGVWVGDLCNVCQIVKKMPQ